ncbi:hypothetical protein BJX76DRAFT_318509 [Aspergillus varians]
MQASSFLRNSSQPWSLLQRHRADLAWAHQKNKRCHRQLCPLMRNCLFTATANGCARCLKLDMQRLGAVKLTFREPVFIWFKGPFRVNILSINKVAALALYTIIVTVVHVRPNSRSKRLS